MDPYNNELTGGSLSSLMGMPIKIYLIVAVLTSIIFFVYKTIKGEFPGLSMLLFTVICILVSTLLMGGLYIYNPLIAWVVSIVLTLISAIGTFLFLTR